MCTREESVNCPRNRVENGGIKSVAIDVTH